MIAARHRRQRRLPQVDRLLVVAGSRAGPALRKCVAMGGLPDRAEPSHTNCLPGGGQFAPECGTIAHDAADLPPQLQRYLPRERVRGGVSNHRRLVVMGQVVRSPYATNAGVIKEQPVPFSHEHHVGDDGIDCRYCHTSVEDGAFAGIPPTQTCMNCHSHVWRDAEALAPVRASYRTGEPLVWNRVHDVPDFAYFDHGIHVHKGVACRTCHGRVDTMPLMWREATLHMEWCLDCHRSPAERVGSREDVFVMDAAEAVGQGGESAADGAVDWALQYHVQSKTNCSVCHR